jgi:alanine racemase
MEFGFSPHIEISLDNVLHNLEQIRTLTGPCRVDINAVVKDNAYGCGSVIIARTLENHGGVRFFSVARIQEAIVLRKEGIKSPILVLGRVTLEEIQLGWAQNITFTLNDLSDLQDWIDHKVQVRFHCGIDTGMSRMGIVPSEIETFTQMLKKSDTLHFEGIFTHMARADEQLTMITDRQIALFNECVSQLKSLDQTPAHIHFCNSATMMRFDIKDCTLVRPGIALYGCNPDPSQDFGLNLKPVAALKSSVVKMKQVEPGTEISYGGRYITGEKTWIATIAIGYAHGLPRFLSNRGEVLIRGQRYRIAGNVTMDYIMVDAGPEPKFCTGDEVVAIGYQGEDYISPDEIAYIGGTIGYEILCNLSTSIDRVYYLKDSIVLHETGHIY